MVMPSIRIMDAVAWVRKYFVAASMDRGVKFFIRMGITASIFISNPIQVINQCVLIRTMMVPEMIVDVMMIRMGGFISTGRG